MPYTHVRKYAVDTGCLARTQGQGGFVECDLMSYRIYTKAPYTYPALYTEQFRIDLHEIPSYPRPHIFPLIALIIF